MNNFANKNVLVTGGTGFIGSHLVEALTKQKANVITTFIDLDYRSYFFSKKLDKNTVLVNVDVCDFDKTFSIVCKYSVDYVFHLAAQSLVESAYYNPLETLRTNILGTVNVLESAKLFPKINGVIIASSDKAYGKLKNKKYKETDALRGDHPYDVSKSAADLISLAYYKTYKIPVAVTRFGNVYGEGDLNLSRLLPGLIKSIINKEEFEIRSDGTYVRDYIYVKDVVSGYLNLAANITEVKGKAFNFGSNDTLSVIDLIKLVEKKLDKKVKYKILNNSINEIPYQSLNFEEISKLKWVNKHSLATTIKTIYSWYKNNLKAV